MIYQDRLGTLNLEKKTQKKEMPFRFVFVF